MPTTKNLWKTYMPDGFTQTSLYTPHHSGCFIHVVVHQKSNQKGEGRGRHTLVHHSSLGHPQPKWIMLHNGIEVLIVPVPIIVSQRPCIPFVLCNCAATFNFQTSTHFRYSLPAICCRWGAGPSCLHWNLKMATGPLGCISAAREGCPWLVMGIGPAWHMSISSHRIASWQLTGIVISGNQSCIGMTIPISDVWRGLGLWDSQCLPQLGHLRK